MGDTKVQGGPDNVVPPVAYRITTIDEQLAICVRLEFIRSPDRIAKKPEALQLVMSPAAAESSSRHSGRSD